MATLNVKNLPDRLYKQLKARAKREHRSVAQEVTHLLSKAVEEPETFSILDLQGLGKEHWKGTDGATFVEEERRSYMATAKRYSLAEARSCLPTIVKEAEAGLEVELTRRGKPIAVVISLQKWERLRSDRPRFSDAYKDFLSKYSLHEVGLEEGFVESIREKGMGREVPL